MSLLRAGFVLGSCVLAAFAQEPKPQPQAQAPGTPPAIAALDRAAELLASMPLQDKAGQLFVSWILSKADGQAEARARMQRWIAEVGLGGVILSLGSVQEAAALTAELQAASKIPLILASDFEGGVAGRLTGATAMGNQMLVGATGLSRLARAMGEVTGEEAMALGIPWVFAPVLDVNSNPQNPIINVRSFGEDPAAVARLGSAFAQGVRSRGAVPCGKHFPGHGDVSSDSHLALPTVPGDGERLRAVELLPFRVAAQQGLESVMTGHLSVPGLGEDPAVPATLSPKILGGVLRAELGFRGLVVTDALDMGGVRDKLPPGEVAVRALLAGADVLLMPPDPVAARDAVVAAVAAGRVPMARLDDAVLRLLRLKDRLGLLQAGSHGPQSDWPLHVDQKQSQAVGEEIARRGLTLVRDPRGLVPLRAGAPWTLVAIRDQAGDAAAPFGAALAEELRAGGVPLAQVVQAGPEPAELAAASAALAEAPRVLVALSVKVREFSGTIGLPPAILAALGRMRPEQEQVALSFGSPYVVQQLPPQASFVCAFAASPLLERAAARALAGAPITGRLPVSIPGIAALGAGRTRLPGVELPHASLVNEGLDPALATDLQALLEGAVADRAFPGAVCMVARRGRIVATVAVGRQSYAENAAPVRVDTLYDLASLTKVGATLPVVLRLAADGRLSLDDAVQKWLPDFTGADKERVTLRHLLAHTSGLPATAPFYKTLRGRDAIVAACCAQPLAGAPGAKVVYSDLGLILAMAVVEACAKAPFAQLAQELVWTPLGMTGACFAANSGPAVESPPTEASSERGGWIQGYVHDENAFAMGGISGHAGMFATAQDVMRLCIFLLADGRGLVPAPLIAETLAPQTQVGSTRALGLELLQAGGFGGTQVPPGTFGHTGFTGTSMWCDPVHDLSVVLLTNRVHPTRSNDKIRDVRRRVHDLVRAAVDR